MKEETRSFTFKYDEECPKRLDIFLTEKIQKITRSQIQKAIRAKRVRINGSIGKPGLKLKKGDLIELNLPSPTEKDIVAENIPIKILFHDSDIILVDKPAGLVVHPAPGNERGTMLNALLYCYPELKGIGDIRRPGIVHRLDKGTSGVMVVARSQVAFDHLVSQFKSHSVRKSYTVLVHGVVTEDRGIIGSPIGRNPLNRKRFSILSNKGKEAVTEWFVIDRFQHFSLLDVQTKTGRTHQIRVHLSSINHPVVGDGTYGGIRRSKAISKDNVKKVIQQLRRPFLHAKTLEFIHPIKGEYVKYESPLPEDLYDIIRFLESNDRG